MNKNILNTEIQEFINTNLNFNTSSILLKGTAFNAVSTKEIIEQIEAKRRCKDKLSSWFNAENIYYPNKLNIEQTSSETTAKYKSELIQGKSIIDLTGGFGVDCFYFAKQFEHVEHCEINEDLSTIVDHNFKQLNTQNIHIIKTDGIEYLKNNSKVYDWIYLDPSRRHESKGKVFFLNDCLPNIPHHLNQLFKQSKRIMIKTSPLLDLSIGINELNHVKTIHIVAVNNEVKELLWILEAGYNKSISVKTINIKNNTRECFQFLLHEEAITNIEYSEPLSYLYEPNAAILKAGAFNQVAKQLNLLKLHKHSHLYTSNSLNNFPGRRFKVNKIIDYNKKVIKKLGLKKANITTRNFPETVNQIRNKLKILDGGNIYLFFTTDKNEQKIMIIASKI